MKYPATILLLLFATCGLAGAATVDEQLEELKSAMRQEIRNPNPKDPNALSHGMDLQTYLVELAGAMDSEKPAPAIVGILNRIESVLGSEKSRALCHTLAQRIHDEREQGETALVERMKAEYSATLRAALDAKDIKELDPLILKVNRLVADAQLYRTDGKVGEMSNHGRLLSEFLRGWQDVLGGSNRSSVANLRNLLNYDREFGEWMPRSEVLSRLTAAEAAMSPPRAGSAAEKDVEAKARQIVADTHTLAEMKDSLEKLERLSTVYGGSNSYLTEATRNLKTLQRYYVESEKGVLDNRQLSILLISNDSHEEAFVSLQSQLVLHMLPLLLGVAAADAPKPGEEAHAYVHRVEMVARDRADWELLNRALDLEQTSWFSATASNDRWAVHAYLAGTNFVRARQYAQAVASFQRALNTGSQLISAEMIGDRLDIIRKEHPQEYETGIKATLPTAPEASKPK